MNIGAKIRRLRIKRNLTQEELAGRCDLSKGFISQVERDLNSPSISTLIDILDCLGVDLKEFFSDSDDDKIIFNKEDVYVKEAPEYSICWLISNAQKNKMEPILISIKSGGKSEIYNPHDGEVFGYVMTGSVGLKLGDKKHKAKKGASFYFKAAAPYCIENNGAREAGVILVSTPPSF